MRADFASSLHPRNSNSSKMLLKKTKKAIRKNNFKNFVFYSEHQDFCTLTSSIFEICVDFGRKRFVEFLMERFYVSRQQIERAFIRCAALGDLLLFSHFFNHVPAGVLYQFAISQAIRHQHQPIIDFLVKKHSCIPFSVPVYNALEQNMHKLLLNYVEFETSFFSLIHFSVYMHNLISFAKNNGINEKAIRKLEHFRLTRLSEEMLMWNECFTSNC